MRWGSGFIGVMTVLATLSASFIAIMSTVPGSVSATGLPPVSCLEPNKVYQNDFTTYTDLNNPYSISQILGNKTSITTLGSPPYYTWHAEEDSPYSPVDDTKGYVGWYCPSKTDPTSIYGHGIIRVGLADPLYYSPYYEIRVVTRALIFEGTTGSTTPYVIGDWYTNYQTMMWYRLSVGYLDLNIGTVYNQTRAMAYSQSNLAATLEFYSSLNSYYDLDDFPNWCPEGYSTATDIDGIYISDASFFDENPAYDRPWTHQEVCNMWLKYEHYQDSTMFDTLGQYSGGGLTFALIDLWAIAVPVDYEPEPTPVGSFVLRPESDDDIFNFNTKTDSNTQYFAQVNETDMISDNNDSFVYTAWTNYTAYTTFHLTDPPSWAEDTTYYIYPWVRIRSTMEGDVGDSFFLILLGSLSTLGSNYSVMPISEFHTYWSNNSFESSGYVRESDGGILPYYLQPWTITELKWLRIMAYVANTVSPIFTYGYFYISQVGVLCIPTTSPDFTPWDEGETDDDGFSFDMLDWLTEGGIVSIFGIMGFVGMIAVPTLGYLRYKDGDDGFETLLTSVMVMALFFGFFLVGIYAG